ncbi:hypothetical protein KUTeg_021828, partial [Tegillarca granosa]
SALGSPVRSIVSIKGKITKVSPATTKTVNEQNVPFQELTLKDKTGKATVAIWEDMVNTFTSGQFVKLSKCRVRLFNEEKKFSTTTASVIRFFPLMLI